MTKPCMPARDNALRKLRYPAQYMDVLDMLTASPSNGAPLDAWPLMSGPGLPRSEDVALFKTIDGVEFLRLLEQTFAICRSSPTPITHYAPHVPMTVHGLLGIAVISSNTVGDALDCAVKYLKINNPGHTISRIDRGDETHVSIKLNHDFGELGKVCINRLNACLAPA